MFSESVQYTSRGRFVYTQVTKTVVSRGVQSLGSGFPIGASSIPVGTRFSAGKSSVLYLCFRLTRERGLRRSLHDSRVWQQTLFRGSRTGGFCDVGYGTNAGFLRSKIRLAGEGSRGIYSPHPAAAPRTKTTTAAPAIGCPSQYLPTSLRGFPAD